MVFSRTVPRGFLPSPPPGGAALIAGQAMALTIGHFFPDLNHWLDRLPCGRVLQHCQENRWSYVLTFKKGHMPAVWADFQGLLALCPENVLERTLPEGTRQVYRWARRLSYGDDQKRHWTFNALQCEETSPTGELTLFAWITDLPLTRERSWRSPRKEAASAGRSKTKGSTARKTAG